VSRAQLTIRPLSKHIITPHCEDPMDLIRFSVAYPYLENTITRIADQEKFLLVFGGRSPPEYQEIE
jgi:hypothetical protein